MKISLKYKLLVIIVFLFLILIFCSTLITYFYTARHQENFFVNKLSKKQASYQKKNELIKNVFSELSEEMRNLYKRNIENDFREFYFSLENSLIIESLQAQTEALAQLANKYKTENFAILEEKGIIQIANDINLWNKPILSFLETKNIKLNENLKDFVCSEYENYFVITAKLKVKNRKFNIYFFVNIQELLNFTEPQKNKILENIKDEEIADFAELTADKNEIKKIGFQLLKIFTLTNLIIFILGAIIISIALKLMLTKLAKIQSAIKEIKNKNYGYRVKLHSYLKDEFDDFAEQTNLMAEHIENEKLNELIEVTEKLLPQRREIIFSDYSVSGYIQQSREIGGDFYDLIEITENKYICVIADVVGKSFPAAYLMTLAINSIRLLCKQYDNNTSFLSALNDYIKNYTPSGKWFTMIFSVIDLLDNKIEIINCGHPSAFFYKTNNTIEISSQLPMIGQFSSEKFNKYLAEYSQNQCIHNFEKNNILIIYTDGLSDLVQNNNCNIKTLFHEFCDNNDFKKNADNFLNFIKTKLHNFDIKDDLTFCIITRH